MPKHKEFLDDISIFFPTSNEDLVDIYFILTQISKKRFWDNKIKIGYSNNVEKRLMQLKIGNPFTVSIFYFFKIEKSRARQLEKKLHSKFKWSRESGEWFKPHPYVKEWINAHKAESKFKTNISKKMCINRGKASKKIAIPK